MYNSLFIFYLAVPALWRRVSGILVTNQNDQIVHDFQKDTHSVLCNQMGTVFTEMSSWTALTRYLRMKTTSDQIFRSQYVRIVIMKILDFKSDGAKCIRNTAHNNKELKKLGFSDTVVILSFLKKGYKNPNIFAFLIFDLKCCLHPGTPC